MSRSAIFGCRRTAEPNPGAPAVAPGLAASRPMSSPPRGLSGESPAPLPLDAGGAGIPPGIGSEAEGPVAVAVAVEKRGEAATWRRGADEGGEDVAATAAAVRALFGESTVADICCCCCFGGNMLANTLAGGVPDALEAKEVATEGGDAARLTGREAKQSSSSHPTQRCSEACECQKKKQDVRWAAYTMRARTTPALCLCSRHCTGSTHTLSARRDRSTSHPCVRIAHSTERTAMNKTCGRGRAWAG